MDAPEDDGEAEPTELAEVQAAPEVAATRAALHAIVLDSSLTIEEVIAHCTDLVQAAVPSDGDGADDDLTGAPIGARSDDHPAMLRRRLVAASVCPWLVRPSHAREKLGRWQRLRLLECLGFLRSCWQRGPDGMRLCCLSDKRHRGCRDRRALKPDACQVGELLILSQEIGGLDFYAQYRPTLVEGAEVAPLEWPSGNSAAAKRMVSALWARFREPTHALSIGLRDRVSTMKGGAAPRTPEVPVLGVDHETNAACALPAAVNTHGAGRQDIRARSPQVVIDPKGSWGFAPFHGADTCSRNAVSDVRTVTPTVDIPLSLRGRRQELGDHALYVVGLLTRPHEDKPRNARERSEANDGWHPLTFSLLQRDLGQHRVDGRQVDRATALLGSRNSPGMLERLGVIERRADYSAGGVAGYSQRWRLTEQYRAEKTCEVDLVLRERVTSLPARRKKTGPAVHPWLVESYGRLGLDTAGCLAELARQAGLHCAVTFEAVAAATEAMTPAAPVLTRGGGPAKKQPADPRRQWRSKLESLAKWRHAGSHLEHTLYRDPTVGRLFSAVTDLPSWARARLTIDGEPVTSLDIRACGLTIQAAMMRVVGADTNTDVAVVCDLIEDPTRDPYAALAVLLLGAPQSDETREEVKRRVLKDLWFSTIGAQLRAPMGLAVRERLPGFHEYLLQVKREIGHSELAARTMQVESALVIDLLPPVLAAEGIALATVHDCMIVKAREAARAKVLFEGVLHGQGVRAVVM